MSADEFDPAIERLFAQTPVFADSTLFEADVAARLSKASRMRSIALSLAGLIGGVIAVRELVAVDLNLGAGEASASVTAGRGLSPVALDSGITLQTLMERSGLTDMAIGVMGGAAGGAIGGVQLFWATAGVLAALLAMGAVKLSQQI